MQYRKGMCFSLDFSWYSVHLDIVRLRLMGCSVWEGGEGEFVEQTNSGKCDKMYLLTVLRQEK